MIVRVRKDGLIMDQKRGVDEYSNSEKISYVGKTIDDIPYDKTILRNIKQCIDEVIDSGEPYEYQYTVVINGTRKTFYTRW